MAQGQSRGFLKLYARTVAPAFLACLCAVWAGCLGAASEAPPSRISIPRSEALKIGNKIWMNECGGKVEGLTSWNQGEEFASLGIGHFIWYPRGYSGPFTESFPELLKFLDDNGVGLPSWLQGRPLCPWNSREEFLRDAQSPRMIELRQLLTGSVALQARFEANRLEAALPKILASLPPEGREGVRRQFYRVAAEPMGLYALMDFVNFKGEGTSPTERYKGEGWGLLQALQGMSGNAPGKAALEEFARSAENNLTRRVKNSPPERNESRWLPVWKRRIATYLQ